MTFITGLKERTLYFAISRKTDNVAWNVNFCVIIAEQSAVLFDPMVPKSPANRNEHSREEFEINNKYNFQVDLKAKLRSIVFPNDSNSNASIFIEAVQSVINTHVPSTKTKMSQWYFLKPKLTTFLTLNVSEGKQEKSGDVQIIVLKNYHQWIPIIMDYTK